MVIKRNTGNPQQFLQDGESYPYQFDVQRAIRWLGERYLLAAPINQTRAEIQSMPDSPSGLRSQHRSTMAVQIPVGYEIISEISEDEGVGTLYSFKRSDGTHTTEAWSWKMGCIDAMWEDVRARATAAHVPSRTNVQRNASFAMGYLQGKEFIDAQVRVRMAQAGYVFGHGITAIETVEKLLVMLNGKH